MTKEKNTISEIFMNNEIDLISLLRYIWSERKKVIIIVSLFTIIGLTYVIFATPWYESKVKILPSNDNGPNLSQYSNLASLIGINIGNINENRQRIYPEIIESNFVLDHLLEHKFQTQKSENPITLFEFWEIDIDTTEPQWKHKLYGDKKKDLRENYIDVSLNQDNSVLTISVQTPDDPVLAAELANFIVDQLDFYNKHFRKYKATEQKKFISISLQDTEEKLLVARNKVIEFKEKNKNLSSPETQMELNTLELEMKVQETLYIELKKQLELVKIEEIKEVDTIEILEKAVVSLNRTKPRRVTSISLAIIFGILSSLTYVIGIFILKSIFFQRGK